MWIHYSSSSKTLRNVSPLFDNSPLEGGLKGLALFKYDSIDRLCRRKGSPITDLGTAFVFIDSEKDADSIISEFDKRPLVCGGGRWDIKTTRDME